MLQITRRGDYAIRGMLSLAGKPNHRITLISEIASDIGVSKTFLAKIFQEFSKAGLVNSYRGAGGGFTLGRPAKKITLLEILEAVEGPITLSKCVLSRRSCRWESACPVNPVLRDLRDQVRRTLNKISLDQLLKS
jgi:Rrf2 family protein